MDKPSTSPEVSDSWNELREETEQISQQFRERVLEEIKRRTRELGIQLSSRDIFEAGFLPVDLPPELRVVIVQSRKVLDALEALSKGFPRNHDSR